MYMEVIKLDPNHHAAWYNLGYVQEELQLFDSAIKSFTEALKLEPNDKDAIINLGGSLIRCLIRCLTRSSTHAHAQPLPFTLKYQCTCATQAWPQR